jgi:hypothetical protein
LDSLIAAEVALGKDAGNAPSVDDDEMADAVSSHLGMCGSGGFAKVNRDDANGHDVS